jgi:hypothetical protein
MEFTTLCRLHHAVGCWRGYPVIYYLHQPPPGPPEALMEQLGWSPHERLVARRLVAGAPDRMQRLKGYVGWLLTEPAFVEATRRLESGWQALAPADRPLFPLSRNPLFADWGATVAPLDAVVEYLKELRAFLDRWGLTELSTWGLPNPQGPLLPNLLPPGAPAQPAHGIHLFLPLHYPLQGDDDLMRQILDFQRRDARDLGLDESLAGLPHHKGYASLFDVLHLDRSIRARLPPGRPAPGLAVYLEGAVATGLKVSLAQVQKCRKAISACLRGKRDRVRWLRPRSR